MKLFQTLHSAEDASVNFVFDNGLEARYVRRDDEKLLVYVSSHVGCNQACRMCHLTQTGQTAFEPVDPAQYLIQVAHVMGHYKKLCEEGHPHAKRISLNFMARGEPMLNPQINQPKTFDRLVHAIQRMMAVDFSRSFDVFNLSTIMPVDGNYPNDTLSRVYWLSAYNAKFIKVSYSLYSLNPAFRKRWLPKAMDPAKALDILANWQHHHPNQHRIVLHWALIEGENDSLEDAEAIAKLVENSGVRAKFNLVRYNPYSPAQGKEPSEITLQKYFELLSSRMPHPGSRIVPRVGYDVRVSCGTFIEINPK